MVSLKEIWKPVLGLEDKYSISNQGRLRNNRSGQILLGSLVKGYRQYSLWRDDGTIYVRRSHLLVLESFVGPRPSGMRGLHWDDNGDNNFLENLRWGTASDNMRDMVRNGRHGGVNKVKCRKGHDYDESNTYVHRSSNKRSCKKCKLMEQRKRLNQTPRKPEV